MSEDTVESTWDPIFGHFGSENLQNIHQIYIEIIILQFSYLDPYKTLTSISARYSSIIQKGVEGRFGVLSEN